MEPVAKVQEQRQGGKYLAIARADAERIAGPQMVSEKKEEEVVPVSYLEELYGAASYRSGSSSQNEGYITERD